MYLICIIFKYFNYIYILIHCSCGHFKLIKEFLDYNKRFLSLFNRDYLEGYGKNTY